MEAPPSSRFSLPIGDELEELQEDRRVTTIPYKTKAATAWGVGIFTDWASKRILKLYHLSREFAVWRPLYRNRISVLYHLSQLLITAHST